MKSNEICASYENYATSVNDASNVPGTARCHYQQSKASSKDILYRSPIRWI